MPSTVSLIPAAPSDVALAHFETAFGFETDCWDVHHALTTDTQDFVLLDVRSHELYKQGHLPQAISLPHGKSSPLKWRNGHARLCLSSTVQDRIATVLIAAQPVLRVWAIRSR